MLTGARYATIPVENGAFRLYDTNIILMLTIIGSAAKRLKFFSILYIPSRMSQPRSLLRPRKN